MGLLSSIKSFLGFDDEDDKKKKSQPQKRSFPGVQYSNNNRQAPGSIVLPTQRQNDPNRPQNAPKKPDNTISLLDKPDLPEVLKKAAPKPAPKPKTTQPEYKLPSNGEIVARSAGRVGTNVVGGLIGMAKGLVETPAFIAESPKLVKMGAAWATKNDEALKNAAAEENKGTRFAESYRKKVAPVTDPLTKAELATDKKANEIADWGTDFDKNLTKGVTNLIPIDGAAKLVKVSKASKLAKTEKALSGAADVVDTVADVAPSKIPTGMKSVNPTREADALKQGAAEAAALPAAPPEMDPLQIAAAQAAEAGKQGDIAARKASMLAESPASSLRKMPANGIQEPVPGQIPVRQPLQADPNIAPAVLPDDNTPAFMRRGQGDPAQDALDAQRLEADRLAQVADPELDRPAFMDRMYTPERITDNLRNEANNLARDPDFADVIQEAYLKTGHTNPLSIAADALAMTTDKGRVRAMLERLVPGIDGNSLNRAVNSVTGADDQTDILEALQVAATRVRKGEPVPAETPFGPLSTDPALPPEGFDPVPVRTREDGAQIMSDDSVRGSNGESLGRVNKLEEPTPEPVEPTIPSFTDAPAATLSKTAKSGADSDVPTKVGAVEKTDAPVKVKAETTAPAKIVEKTSDKPAKALPKTPQKDLPDANVSKAAESGEIGKSQGKYSRGQEYEKSSNAASNKRGADQAANTSFDDFIAKVEDGGGLNGADRDAAVALQKRFKQGSSEHRLLGDLVNKYHTKAAQALATIDRVIRKTASADKLTDRFVSRLYKATDESVDFTDKDFDIVIKKNEEFVAARDAQNEVIDAFNKNPTPENAKAVADAFKKVDDADRAARFQEYKTASELTKGSKNPTSRAYVKDLERKAGVYTMDLVDSSMLSSSRVMINNFINTFGVRAEEMMFGKAGAAVARLFTKTTIGGGSRAGSKLGRKMGTRHWLSDSKLRQGANENILTKTVKNFTTTGNTIGDRNTYAAAYSGVFDHYKVKLKAEGFKGDELDRRAMVNSLADPDDVAYDYMNQALANNAMSSITNGPNKAKIETFLTDKLAAYAGGGKVATGGAKLLVRMTLGFPTVIGRSLFQGTKRATLGFPSAGHAVFNAITKGPQEQTALYLKNAIKEAGSGATMYAVGFGLGSTGIITGSYPQDKAERERWKREGITENSIKIGNDYYSLPAALGVFALPFMIGANSAGHVQEGGKITDDFVKDTFSTIVDSMPIDNVTSVLKILTDAQAGKDVGSAVARLGASATRALTPLGSLVNQVAKMFDPTANDTTQGDALAQFLHKVQDGIPGLTNKLPAKTVDGKEIKNPDPLAKFLGAVSTEQKDGVEKTEQIKEESASQSATLKDAGVFTPKLREVLDDDTKTLFDKASKGEQITPEEMKKLQSGIVKNVTATEDTRYLEDGDYDTNLAVLRAKKAIMEQDKTTQKGDLEDYDKQIARGEVYKELRTPYKNIKKYKDISLEEWRELGDPESDDYDADLYETLFDLDAALTDSGVSGKSSDSTKPKYYAKASKSGSGGGGGGGGRGSAESAELRRIQSNTISDTPNLKKVDLSDLAPKKLQSAQLPKIQQIRSSDLIKKRKITVGKA